MRAVTRVSRPAGVGPPWRSSRSWSLRLLTIDSIRWRIQPIGGLGRSGSSCPLGRSSRARSSWTARGVQKFGRAVEMAYL